jgi:hypothetical protein
MLFAERQKPPGPDRGPDLVHRIQKHPADNIGTNRTTAVLEDLYPGGIGSAGSNRKERASLEGQDASNFPASDSLPKDRIVTLERRLVGSLPESGDDE